MTRPLLAILLSVVFFLSACVGPTEPPPTSIAPIDQSVVATVRMNLNTDPELAASGLSVSAENDLLVLRGQVPSEAAKRKAEEIARKTPRISKVANHLEVAGGDSASRP
jgi:osmotically-inducible protein OsmY